jgi:hypothetical protein
MFSTFLNGFVALLATASFVIAGFQIDFIRKILEPDNPGGLSFESMFRVFTRASMVSELEPNLTSQVIIWLDSGVYAFLVVILQVLPDMGLLSSTSFVSQGFGVPWNTLWIQLLVVLGFVVPLCLFSHYVLKGREIAA